MIQWTNHIKQCQILKFFPLIFRFPEWNSQEDAERLYTDEWKQFIFDKYGALPSVTYFESPVIVDNTIGEIITDDK